MQTSIIYQGNLQWDRVESVGIISVWLIVPAPLVLPFFCSCWLYHLCSSLSCIFSVLTSHLDVSSGAFVSVGEGLINNKNGKTQPWKCVYYSNTQSQSHTSRKCHMEEIRKQIVWLIKTEERTNSFYMTIHSLCNTRCFCKEHIRAYFKVWCLMFETLSFVFNLFFSCQLPIKLPSEILRLSIQCLNLCCKYDVGNVTQTEMWY